MSAKYQRIIFSEIKYQEKRFLFKSTPIQYSFVLVDCNQPAITALFEYSDSLARYIHLSAKKKSLPNITDELGIEANSVEQSDLAHTVCHRGFLNISADKKSRRLLLQLAL